MNDLTGWQQHQRILALSNAVADVAPAARADRLAELAERLLERLRVHGDAQTDALAKELAELCPEHVAP